MPAVVAVVALGAARLVLVLEPGALDLLGHGHGARRLRRRSRPRARAAGVSVADLTGPPDGEPDVAVDLAARAGSFELASGERVQGYTLNGTSPGPEIQAHQGDLVQVTLINVDVPDGRDAALARRRRAQRRGRRRGRHAGRRPARAGARLPVRRRGRRHVLVPLAPGRRTTRCAAGCSARSSSCRADAGRARGRDRRRCTPTADGGRWPGGPGSRRSTPPRALRCACAWSTPTTARCAPG